MSRIINETELLEKFSRMGRVVPEIEVENIREIIIYSYRLIYEIVENEIHVLTIIHGKRDFKC